MKLILTFLLIGLSSTVFAQSKKAINRTLSLELKQVKATNDSLKNEYAELLKSDLEIHRDIEQVNDKLTEKRKEIMVSRYSIHMMKGDMSRNGFNPEEFVTDTELKAIYSLINDVDYDMESYKITSKMSTIQVKELGDISAEKIKVQNELLQQKINEYKLANENDLKVVFKQQEVTEDLEKLKTVASDQLEICRQAAQTLNEKYELLSAKYTELEDKAEAERLKRLEEEKRNAKKKKPSKTKFAPPVIIEIEPEEEADMIVYDPYNQKGEVDVAEPVYYKDPPPVMAENDPKDEIYQFTDEQPEFPGGREAMGKYFADNLKYPQSAIEAGIEGKVYLKFVISETGEVSSVVVVRGIWDCKECDAEALRVIKNMPKWTPGKNGGKAVRCYYTIPVAFKLESK